ncbi:MAG: hypothetical protein ABI988_05355 [Nitrospirota bacterium]
MPTIVRELFWAAIGISGYQDAGLAIMLIVLCAILGIWLFGRKWLEKQFKQKYGPKAWTEKAPSIIASILTAILLIIPTFPNPFGAHAKQNLSTANPSSNDQAPVVSMSSDCQLSPKTVVMPSSGVLYALWILPNPEVGSGLAKLSGRVGSETNVAIGNNILVFRCDVVNHGRVPIFNVEMTLHLKVMEVVNGSASESRVKLTRGHPILMPEIGIGTDGKFSFYISNTSEYMVSITLPDMVRYKGSKGDTELVHPHGLQMLPPSL